MLQRSAVATDPARRFTDLAIQFEVVDGPQPGRLLEPYGGRWDRILGAYCGHYEPGLGWYGDKPKRIHRVRIAHQCVEFIEDWDHLLILAEGGRRSGKTTGALAPKIIVCMLVFPGLAGEVLSPTYKQTRNVRKALLRHVPRSWWDKWPQPSTPPITMSLVNGSSVTMLSADNEDSARSEGVAWGAYDERQDIADEAAGNAIMSTSEGEQPYIFQTATIKPSLKSVHDAMVASDQCKIYPMDSYGNPFTGKRFLELAEEMLDDETIDREIHAKWPELFGRIYGAWDAFRMTLPYPAPGATDATAAFLGDRFGMQSFGLSSPEWFISIDPPGTAGLWKIYSDETMHLVHEVLVGADGEATGVEVLARRVHGIVGHATAVVVQDPHEHKWDVDVIRQFRALGGQQYKFVSLRPTPVMYKHASVRARMQRNKLLIDPRCKHALEVLEKHCYKDDGSGGSDKRTCYSKSHRRESRKIQLVHLSDVLGYGCFKLFPTKVDYEKLEKERDAA